MSSYVKDKISKGVCITDDDGDKLIVFKGDQHQELFIKVVNKIDGRDIATAVSIRADWMMRAAIDVLTKD